MDFKLIYKIILAWTLLTIFVLYILFWVNLFYHSHNILYFITIFVPGFVYTNYIMYVLLKENV